MMQFHPAANIVPLLSGEAYEALKADIRANGQQMPIATWMGQVLDGRSRLRACLELNIPPAFQELKRLPGNSPTMYVLSANLQRRQLSPSQLAMVSARAREHFDAEAKLRQTKRTPADDVHGDTRNLASPAPGVSGKTTDCASKVLNRSAADTEWLDIQVTLKTSQPTCSPHARFWVDLEPDGMLDTEFEIPLQARAPHWRGSLGPRHRAGVFHYRLGLVAHPGAEFWLTVRTRGSGQLLLHDGDILDAPKCVLLGTCWTTRPDAASPRVARLSLVEPAEPNVRGAGDVRRSRQHRS